MRRWGAKGSGAGRHLLHIYDYQLLWPFLLLVPALCWSPPGGLFSLPRVVMTRPPWSHRGWQQQQQASSVVHSSTLPKQPLRGGPLPLLAAASAPAASGGPQEKPSSSSTGSSVSSTSSSDQQQPQKLPPSSSKEAGGGSHAEEHDQRPSPSSSSSTTRPEAEPPHIRQLRQELESILNGGSPGGSGSMTPPSIASSGGDGTTTSGNDVMLTSTAAILETEQRGQEEGRRSEVRRLARWLVGWWVRLITVIGRVLRWGGEGGRKGGAAGGRRTRGEDHHDMPRPDLTQRLITTWTRFLHNKVPWLLGHPIFFGRPFPWQWGNWRPPLVVVSPITTVTEAAGLPSLGSLLHDMLPTTAAAGDEGTGTPPITESLARGTTTSSPPPSSSFFSSSVVVVLEQHHRPSSSLLQPAALTSPVPTIHEGSGSGRHRDDRHHHDEDDAATLFTWPEEDPPRGEDEHHMQHGDGATAGDGSSGGGSHDKASSSSSSLPSFSEEDPGDATSGGGGDGEGVVSLFTSFFPQEGQGGGGKVLQRGGGKPATAVMMTKAGATSLVDKEEIGEGGKKKQQPPQSGAVAVVVAADDDGRDGAVASLDGQRMEKGGSSGTLEDTEVEEEEEAIMNLLREDDGRNETTSAYGRILADLSTEPMAVTEEGVPDDVLEGLEGGELPWAATAPGLEALDKNMVIVAVDSALMVSSKAQLWRFINDIGLAPLLAALQKSLERQEDTAWEEADLLRTEAVEAILNLMKTAMDLQVVRVAVEGRALLGRDVVSNLIDVVEAPLLLLMPKIIKPRNEEVLYRGQRAAVEVLFQTVLASDKAIQLIQEDGRLWNALLQLTAEGMYPPGSPTYVTSHRLLAAIGHNEWRPKMSGQRGLRILSFDGGGTRGVLSIGLLKQVMELVGKDVFETFDIICGTSTGGILAVLFGIEQRKIADAEALYDALVSKIFSSNPILQTTKLLMRQSYYDEDVWEQVLKELLGDMLMVDSMGRGPGSPRVFCASLSLKSNPASLWLWRNYNYAPDQKARHGGSFRIRVRDALRATTAAPTFFAPLETEDAKYCDGAFLANNPTAVALNEARLLYPGVPVEVVLSIGTGYHKDERKADVYGWEGIVNDLINCATNTEVTHETLSVFLPKSKYFRFNPRTENFPLDEIRPERLQRMKRIAREYFWDKENKERLTALAELLKRGPPSPLRGGPLPTFRSTFLHEQRP